MTQAPSFWLESDHITFWPIHVSFLKSLGKCWKKWVDNTEAVRILSWLQKKLHNIQFKNNALRLLQPTKNI